MTLRYGRQSVLRDVGIEGQKAIRSARVLCVGAGGLGSPVIQYLAAAGIGKLGIIDMDRVEVSNLQRQVIFSTAQEGRSKADAAGEYARKLNPDVEVVTWNQMLTAQNALDLFGAFDVVVDGTDNFGTKYLINDAAIKRGIPVVYGSISEFEGQMSVFCAADGPCYRCIYPKPPKSPVQNCAQAGVIGALAGAVGSLQALEVIKLILSKKGNARVGLAVGRLFVLDGLSLGTFEYPVAKRADCLVCSRDSGELELSHFAQDYAQDCTGGTHEIGSEELAGVLANCLIIDVRESHEWESGVLPGARLLPLSVLERDPLAAGPGTNAPCIVYCQSGVRSAKAARLLSEAGFEDVRSLAGGIRAWDGTLVAGPSRM